jgi:hypothetical protein
VDRHPENPTLYFIYATGCPACEMAKPEMKRWWLARKDRVNLKPIDLTRAEWPPDAAWEPDQTPTFLVRLPNGRLGEPLMGYAPGEFLKWIRRYIP